RRWLVLLGVLLVSDSCDQETFTWYRSSDDFVAVNVCERGRSAVSVSSNPLNWPMRYTRIASRFASMWASSTLLIRSSLLDSSVSNDWKFADSKTAGGWRGASDPFDSKPGDA